MKQINVISPIIPELDPGFVPAALWNREYRKLGAIGIQKQCPVILGCIAKVLEDCHLTLGMAWPISKFKI